LSQRDYRKHTRKVVQVDVQADFWNGDPDVDAICRMEYSPECHFEPRYFPIAANKMSPFDSQNTFIPRNLFKDYFPFPHIGRMDDIWAGYYLQSRGAKVMYGEPSVVQRRNAHDVIADMRLEYLGYENNLRLVQALATDPDAIASFLPDRAIRAWQLYRRHFPPG
jgi:hypothetical protein